MFVYNTLNRRKELLEPIDSSLVGLYCCGPTVYNYVHIGNLRAYLFDDVLRRAIRFNGFGLKHVMNITDVGHLESDEDEGEDKMEKGAEREGLSPWEIARKYEAAFFEDTDRLNIERPEVVCRATEHVPEMIALIERLVANGCAYIAEGAVYFDTSMFDRYPELARLDLRGQEAGGSGRVEMLGEKRHPNDFALWFLNKPRHIMQWESPWGRGYPGWHIECSAMSMKYLGESFDIHCGGVDHIPVHHTNEIAQSECATGRQFVKYWMHNEFLIVPKAGGEFGKLSKSEEGESATHDSSDSSDRSYGFLTLKRLIDNGYDPLSYRFLCLQVHYRSELKFSWESLDAAQTGLRRLYSVRPDSDGLVDENAYGAACEECLNALNDDLNTPKLIGLLNRYDSYRLWSEFDSVLGLDIVGRSRKRREDVDEALPSEIQALVDERNRARKEKNWARSDEIRQILIDKNYEVADTPEGTRVKKRLL